MSKGLLSEQMGAMALVDELRHRRMEIEEHLDLPRREAEVAERIRAYYKSQGIDCDDDLVAQGVREFFTHRLVFEGPPMSWRERFLGRLVISTAFRIWMVAMLAFLVVFTVSFYNGYTKSHAPHAPVAPAAARVGSTPEAAMARFRQLHERYAALPLSDADRQRAQRGFDFYAKAAALGGTYADEVLDEFEGQTNFTAPALTLSVTHLADGRTGVEICRQGDGCQQTSRFIFIRASDDEGRPVDFALAGNDRMNILPIKGIEVSQAEYLRFKNDLRDNGRIDEAVVGNSPAANHREFYDKRFSSAPRSLDPATLNSVTLLDSF
ncbi:DUF6384 family protein [Pseudomonas japonica]|uniref:DUF6384 family protein n=1 Tax=Pseudomonas TaxID=286 RepID=UPI00292957D3|nr:DUF6384 family protein [Pseudomonas sp. zfem002]MDU9389667.1 DUF6384 family protein [Pseudomonas sp. zfem002]